MKKILKQISKLFLIKRIEKNSTSIINSNAKIKGAHIEGYNIIEDCDISYSTIGLATSIGGDSIIQHAKIGKFCSIGMSVKVVIATHPLDMVSTHPSFYDTAGTPPIGKGKLKKIEFLKTDNNYSIEIGNDVWIGQSCLLKGGIKIGDGAIIGMGAVVVKDVPPYAIVGGNPAKIIRFKTEQEKIQQLLKIKWWNWPIDKIIQRRDDFQDIDCFLRKYGNK